MNDPANNEDRLAALAEQVRAARSEHDAALAVYTEARDRYAALKGDFTELLKSYALGEALGGVVASPTPSVVRYPPATVAVAAPPPQGVDIPAMLATPTESKTEGPPPPAGPRPAGETSARVRLRDFLVARPNRHFRPADILRAVGVAPTYSYPLKALAEDPTSGVVYDTRTHTYVFRGDPKAQWNNNRGGMPARGTVLASSLNQAFRDELAKHPEGLRRKPLCDAVAAATGVASEGVYRALYRMYYDGYLNATVDKTSVGTKAFIYTNRTPKAEPAGGAGSGGNVTP